MSRQRSESRVLRALSRARSRGLEWVFEKGKRFAPIRRRIDGRYDALLDPVSASLRPYRGDQPSFRELPREGIGRDRTLALIEGMSERERERWSEGYVSGAVYHGEPEHLEFQSRVYALSSQVNPLHGDVWPSALKFEAEIVAMTARLLGAPVPETVAEHERVVGTVTSGGTESILLAVKAYRDRARREKKATRAEIVVPESAHAAFDKAGELLDVRVVRVPVGADFRADVTAMRRAIGPRTILLVASAPGFPHGVVDPVAELAALAREHRVGLHVDACLGGFVLPFARRLGRPVPDFDFRLPGVTSMSADTHKYGYAAKGTSVVLYRDPALRRFQYFVSTEWSGGLYFSPTLAGSRPGALGAACWASMVSIGENGYLEATGKILETAAAIRRGIEAIPDLYVLGDPLWLIAFASKTLDVYRVLDAMSERGWSLNGLQRPACIHFCVTLPHTRRGVSERFLADLTASVEEVRKTPAERKGLAPVYGMAGSFPVRGAVAELLRRYVDRLYDP